MRQFIRHALVFKEPFREYGLVCWLFVIGAAGLAFGIVSRTDPPEMAIWGGYLLFLLVAICAIDARFGIIPDQLVLWLAVGGLFQFFGKDWELAQSHVISAVIAMTASLMLRHSYFLWRGEHGLGLGDVKFLFAAGLWIEPERLPLLLLFAVVSAFASIILFWLRSDRLLPSSAISFGPHLAVGLWLVWTASTLPFQLLEGG